MLDVRNVHKSFSQGPNRLHVLKGIDLKIKPGDIVTVVGPSGAGKSTLLHILGGLDQPDEGQVFLEGQEIYKLNDRQRSQVRNRKIGFIFQFYHLLPEFTALENVMLPAMVSQRGTMEELRSKSAGLLTQVGLQERLSHKPNELSGGEQQRVAIARALINEPKIIFCDEPIGNLDSANGHVIMDLLVGLNQKNRQTLVIVTHDEAMARRSSRMIMMKDGQLILS